MPCTPPGIVFPARPRSRMDACGVYFLIGMVDGVDNAMNLELSSCLLIFRAALFVLWFLLGLTLLVRLTERPYYEERSKS